MFILSRYERPQVCAHIRHILYTHQAHPMHTSGTLCKTKYDFWWFLSYMFYVPDVCTYLGELIIRKYGSKAFQRRVARFFTTKTRFCGSNRKFSIFFKIFDFSKFSKILKNGKFWKNWKFSIWATEASFCRRKLLRCSFDGKLSILCVRNKIKLPT